MISKTEFISLYILYRAYACQGIHKAGARANGGRSGFSNSLEWLLKRLANKIAKLDVNPGASDSASSGLPAPIALEALPVPFDNALLYETKSLIFSFR